MVAPDPLVGQVDPPLALGVGGDEGAVGVEDGAVEELRGLLGPDAAADAVEGVHEGQDVGFGEAAAEVARGGGVGDASGSEGVEVGLVVAPGLDVLEASSAGEEVESDVQYMVGLVVGEVPL